MNLGELIRSKRESLQMSLQDLADSVGITKAHVWDMEQGNSRNMTFKTAVRLAAALNIHVGMLVAAYLEELP